MHVHLIFFVSLLEGQAKPHFLPKSFDSTGTLSEVIRPGAGEAGLVGLLHLHTQLTPLPNGVGKAGNP